MRGYLSDILSSAVLLWACVMLLMSVGTTNLDFVGRDLHRLAGSPFAAMAVILAVDLANGWRLGGADQGRGLLLLLTAREQQVKLEVGYNLIVALVAGLTAVDGTVVDAYGARGLLGFARRVSFLIDGEHLGGTLFET